MRIALSTPAPAGELATVLAALGAWFPGFSFEVAGAAPDDALTSAAWWSDDLDFWAFDRRLDELAARGAPLVIAAPLDEALDVAREVAVRAQRLAPERTPASRAAWFERVLDEHRALHDLDRPLVRADYDHALDAWQWVVRRDPDAPCSLQLAALLHDVERLVRERDARVEHHAADYQAFKDAHARAGAELARAVMAKAGVPEPIAHAAATAIASHERGGTALDDADALSFFALNSPGYLRYFGAAQTARKVDYTLRRMSPAAIDELACVRVPRPVADAIERVLAGSQPCAS